MRVNFYTFSKVKMSGFVEMISVLIYRFTVVYNLPFSYGVVKSIREFKFYLLVCQTSGAL